MVDNPEYPEIYHSTDDEGGTLFYELKTGGPLSRGGPLDR